MMTSAQVVETSVSVITNSPSQDYTHLDDHTSPTYDMTPEFKPFTVKLEITEKKTNNNMHNWRKPKRFSSKHIYSSS